MSALFVSTARSVLNSVSCRRVKPVWTNGPSDCSPAAIAKITVRIAPHVAVITPMSPSIAAAVRMKAGARPSGAVTGIAIAMIACSLRTSRIHTHTPMSANRTASPGTNRKMRTVSMAQAIASAAPSWPANATIATRPAAASDVVRPKLARTMRAKTGSEAVNAKNTRRIGWP